MSGRPLVWLSRRSTAAAACGWFAGEHERLQQILIDSWYTRRTRSAANAGSVMLEPRDEAQQRLLLLLPFLAGDDADAVGATVGQQQSRLPPLVVAGIRHVQHVAVAEHKATSGQAAVLDRVVVE